jgi:hypothetical protein
VLAGTHHTICTMSLPLSAQLGVSAQGHRMLGTAVEGKRSVSPVHVVKVYTGSRVIAPLILTWALDGSEWLSSSPGRLNTRKEPMYPLYRRLGGPQNR